MLTKVAKKLQKVAKKLQSFLSIKYFGIVNHHRTRFWTFLLLLKDVKEFFNKKVAKCVWVYC